MSDPLIFPKLEREAVEQAERLDIIRADHLCDALIANRTQDFLAALHDGDARQPEEARDTKGELK